MNAKTLEAITRHGKSLLAAFPNATTNDPVKLCKQLRRIETSLTLPILRECNESRPEGELDKACEKGLARAAALLGLTPRGVVRTGLHVNRDPRGYALKFESDWTKEYNTGNTAKRGGTLYTDWGGFGILAPDLTTK